MDRNPTDIGSRGCGVDKIRVPVESTHQNDKILTKFSLWKALRIKC